MVAEMEFVEVEAEVIEPEHVELVPARIDSEAYLAAKRGWLERMLEPYEGMDDDAIAQMDVKEAKACHADLGRIIAEVEAERKAIKKAYNEPLERFEAAVKELLGPATEAKARIKGYIDRQEAVRRQLKADSLRAAYEEYAPALVPVVPFERILDPRWLNKTVSQPKAEEAMCDAVGRIAKDWELLKKMRPQLEFYDEDEAVFFRTLDLAEATAHDDMRKAERERIEAMRADVEEYRAEAAAEPREEPQEPTGGPNARRRRYMFTAMLNGAEVEALREWKNALGIGEGWTFKECDNG